MDVVNAVDPSVVLGYVPLGSGNALRYALRLPKRLDDIVKRIRDGHERALDLILCDGSRKGLFASMGIDSEIAKTRESYLGRNVTGLRAYAQATVKTVLAGCKRTHVTFTIDGETLEAENVISIMVSKIPYYGYRLKVMPEAQVDDGRLHLKYVNSHLLGCAWCVATSWLGGNRVGAHRTAEHVRIVTADDLFLQIQGTVHRQGREFEFAVLPGALKMRY
jgi:diacylglycerol kinase family enzyme